MQIIMIKAFQHERQGPAAMPSWLRAFWEEKIGRLKSSIRNNDFVEKIVAYFQSTGCVLRSVTASIVPMLIVDGLAHRQEDFLKNYDEELIAGGCYHT